MITRLEKLYLVLKELGLKEQGNLNNFTVIQKTMYILSRMGLDLLYQFRWYSHGPYCPELSDDLFDNYKYDGPDTLKTSPLAIITLFKMLFEDRYTDKLWLQIIASILFMEENGNDENYLNSLKIEHPDKVIEGRAFVLKNFKYLTNNCEEGDISGKQIQGIERNVRCNK